MSSARSSRLSDMAVPVSFIYGDRDWCACLLALLPKIDPQLLIRSRTRPRPIPSCLSLSSPMSVLPSLPPSPRQDEFYTRLGPGEVEPSRLHLERRGGRWHEHAHVLKRGALNACYILYTPGYTYILVLRAHVRRWCGFRRQPT